MIERVIEWVMLRAKEPSTHAALAVLAMAMIPILPANVGLIATGVFGLLGVALKEGK